MMHIGSRHRITRYGTHTFVVQRHTPSVPCPFFVRGLDLTAFGCLLTDGRVMDTVTSRFVYRLHDFTIAVTI